MKAVVRGIACWLLFLVFQPALAVGAGNCATTLSNEQGRYFEACLSRGSQCTDYWPGYPEDLSDCTRLRKWLIKAMAMPQSMRHEIFGPMPEHVSTPVEETTPPNKAMAAPWKNLPRSQDSAAPRPVANTVAGATATDYAGASSQLDPEQARAAGVAFWTGQMVQIAGIVAEANRAPVSQPRAEAVPISAVEKATTSPLPATTSPTLTRSGISASQPSHSQSLPYKANANSCIGLRGNQLANKCSREVVITFCVVNPRQTKNFFDGSDAFKCPNGGLENISGNGANGLVWHGWVMFFACYANDIATMKTNYVGTESSHGMYHGLCAGPGADGRQEGGGGVYAN